MTVSAISAQIVGLSSADFSEAAQAAAAVSEESAQLEALGSDESVGKNVNTTA